MLPASPSSGSRPPPWSSSCQPTCIGSAAAAAGPAVDYGDFAFVLQTAVEAVNANAEESRKILEDQERIFDKFYRVKNAQTRKITGTGLGLPIVRGIVEAHLGSIEVESQPGIGSKFRDYLPLEISRKDGK